MLLSAQSVEQLAFADVVVINKTDLVTDEEKAALKQRIKVRHVVALVLICTDVAVLVNTCTSTHNLSTTCMEAFFHLGQY